MPYEDPFIQRTQPIAIKSVCGPDSTVVTSTGNFELSQPINADSDFVFASAFISSNEQCPILANNLITDVYENFANTDNTNDGFEL